jgi:hypothetical protein
MNDRVPTTRELVAARKAQAPAVVQGADHLTRYFNEVAPSGMAGRGVKWKDDWYVTTDDGQKLPDSAEYVCLADETMVGWIKWGGTGEMPEKIMGLLFDGFEMPSRESLGDLDQSAWDVGLSGQPQDPWQHQQMVVLQDRATAELFTFITSSVTGRKAVGTLLRHYDRMRRNYPDDLPTVRLGKGGFKHKDSRVGWVDTPLFVVTGRTPKDGAARPPANDLNDAIPF